MDIDAQLLDRYARTRDADAFTQLVQRNAGMVFAVAKRITSSHHDAEEVAQACFLELSRHAGSIHSSPAGWLHQVATHHAFTFNRAAGRRRRYEQTAARPEAYTDVSWDALAPLVDKALAELPEEIRLPVVLYHLEGRTLKQVAAELGVSRSTVSRRVNAGVAALREKLKTAGVMAPSVGLPGLLARHAVVAAPKTLVAVLGKLAISGVVPGVGGVAGSGGVIGVGGKAAGAGSGAASGATSGAASGVVKGGVPLVAKIVAAVVIAGAVSTGGYVAFRPRVQAVVAVGQIDLNIAHYQGWVHAQSGYVLGNGDSKDAQEVFLNTADQKIGVLNPSVNDTFKCDILWIDPVSGVMKQYDRQTNAITQNDIEIDQIRGQISEYQCGPDGRWARLSSMPGFTISRANDDEPGHYQFSAVIAIAATNEHVKMEGSVWIDPDRRLITQIEVRNSVNKYWTKDIYNYGDREISDIYDLGVPRDAAIVDHCMSAELKSVIARLKSEIAQGLGDGVGFLTETETGNPKFGHPIARTLMLFAQLGHARLAMQYPIIQRPALKFSRKISEDKVPTGWPTPSIDDVLRFADAIPTPYLAATDGKTLWFPGTNDGKTFKIISQSCGDAGGLIGWGPINVLDSFWPDPGELTPMMPPKNAGVGVGSRIRSVTLARNPENSSLVGLHISYSWIPKGWTKRIPDWEQTYWLDPTRNDAPVEVDQVIYNGKGYVFNASTTVFLEFAQLPDGRWYPTHWRQTNKKEIGGKRYKDSYLIFDAGKLLDASWYGDPSAHFTPSTESMDSKVPKAPSVLPRAIVAVAQSAYRSAWWWWPWALAVSVFGAATVLLIRQRLNQSPAPPLCGSQGPRRR